MKLKKLKINSHYHLKDLEFDFTYPKGHPKVGQPLDKICFIGQSATGKTNIIHLISEAILYLLRVEIVNNKSVWHRNNYSKTLENGTLEIVFEGKNLILSENSIFYNGREFTFDDSTGGSITNLVHNVKNQNKILYFDSNYVSNANLKYFNTNPLEIVFEKRKINYTDLDEFIFGENSSDIYLIKLLESFLDYRQKYDSKVRELLLKGYVSDLEKFNKEFKDWQNENPSPIEGFSEKFNSLLQKLNLEIDKVNVDYPIPFKNKNSDEVIPVNGLSTGTKALLLYMLPLYQIDTEKSIVLIDEPERSLYPDMQMELMDFYREVSPSAQFIIATHSPFIAASFEPEERFILYFDDNGNVKVKRGISPIGDDPNDILKNDFNIDYINDFGKAAFEKYLALKNKINSEKDLGKKEDLISKYEELGDKYNF